jgi:hypothetical protein
LLFFTHRGSPDRRDDEEEERIAPNINRNQAEHRFHHQVHNEPNAPPPPPPDDADDADANPLLNPNGQRWFDNGEVSIDLGINNSRTTLRWPGQVNVRGDENIPNRTELDYFRLLYPMHENRRTLECTNAKLIHRHYAITTEEELFQYFGLRLNMTLQRSHLSVPEFWLKEAVEGSTFIPPNYGKYGMSRHRFEALSSCLRFSIFDEGIVAEVIFILLILFFFHYFFLLILFPYTFL